jgi:glucosamine kinase
VSDVVVGVDGGGTKTRVLLADERGGEIISVEGRGSAVRADTADESAEVIAGLVREALTASDMAHVRPRVICAGVAGTGREAERQALWQALISQDVADDIVVHSDASIALDDAFAEGAGILLIAGTGSMAVGRGPTGRTVRCGGWGPVMGDEGSGAWIGRRALSAVTASADGREGPTALVGAILTAAEVAEVDDLVAWAKNADPAALATLAPAVASAADAGDLRANSLLTLAVEELALHVRTLGRTLFGDERAAMPVALSGGLMKRGSTVRRRLEHRLRSAVPGAQVHPHDVVPARGAVRGALRMLGLEMSTSP